MDIERNFNFQSLKSLCLKYLVGFALIILANILYQLSLEACPYDDNTTCSPIMQDLLGKLLTELVASTVIFNAVIIYFHNKSIYIVSTIAIINLLMLYNNNNGLTLELTDHGLINMIVSVILSICILFVYGIFTLFKGVAASRFAFITYFFFFVITVYLFKIENKALTCRHWDHHFKNKKIDNSIGCRIKKPKMCIITATYGLNDVTKKLGLSCDVSFQDTSKYYKYSDLVFFPDTRLLSSYERIAGNFYPYVMDNLIYVRYRDSEMFSNNFINGAYSQSKKEILNYYHEQGYEIGIDLTGKNPRLFQKVVRNDQLAETLKARHRENINAISSLKSGDQLPIGKNVMFIFIDSISRVVFKKAFSETFSFLEKFYNYNGELELFQFLKYNTVAPNTFRSAFPALFGVNTYEYKRSEVRENIFDQFRKKGYINTYSANTCSPFPLWFGEEYLPLFQSTNHPPFDHENFSGFCDPSFNTYKPKNGEIPSDISLYLPYIRCLYGKNGFEYVLDYSSQMIKTYKDVSQFQFLYFLDGHEATNEVAKYLDKPLVTFLKKHLSQFIEDKWNLIFYTDHGIHFGLISYPDYIKEMSLPHLALLMPRKFADLYKNDLKHFENLLLTPYDITKMLHRLVGSLNVKTDYQYVDIFDKNTSFSNTCKLSGIQSKFCHCN